MEGIWGMPRPYFPLVSTCAWTIFQQGVKCKNQVLSCNVMRWFSPQPLTSCWLLIQRKGVRGATWMQMINAFVKTQHKSAICNFWPAPNFRGKGGQLTPLTWPSRALVGVSIVNRTTLWKNTAPLSMSPPKNSAVRAVLWARSTSTVIATAHGHSSVFERSVVTRTRRPVDWHVRAMKVATAA